MAWLSRLLYRAGNVAAQDSCAAAGTVSGPQSGTRDSTQYWTTDRMVRTTRVAV